MTILSEKTKTTMRCAAAWAWAICAGLYEDIRDHYRGIPRMDR